MTNAASTSCLKVARSLDRATFVWGMVITALAALGGDAALVSACIALPLAPAQIDLRTRMGLISLAASALALGPSSLIVATPAALALTGFRMAAIRSLFALVAVTLLGHHLENLPPVSWLSIHPGSTGFLLFPAMATVITMGPVVGWRAVVALTVGTLASLVLIDAGAARWIDHTTFTAPIFRLLMALVPIVAASPLIYPQTEIRVGWRGLSFGIAAGAAIAIALPPKIVTSITFDEAHGTWETVSTPFGPDNFGRAVNYTYSLLFKYAKRLVGTATMLNAEDAALPKDGGMFVIKMPTQPLSDAFADRLETWVHNGGRLLIVADHTDLYDSSQYLNAVLTPRFRIKLNSDAVYNLAGMPTVPVTERFATLLGRIDAHGRPFPWQTGTSLGAMPTNTVALAKFGPSFSEPGDYSRQNRFGPFAPHTSLRFTDHVAVAAFGFGQGAVAIILDSTPWSNFSQFKEQYTHIFRAIVYAMERPIALQLWGWGAIALAVVAVAATLWQHRMVLALGGLILGLTVASSLQIGWAAFSSPVEGRDYGLRVVPGEKARLEFLKLLIGPGERNYSRIISAMAKYDLDPIASTPGSEIPDLPKSKRWMLIEPDAWQLPRYEDVIHHLHRGGDLAILFAPDQAANPAVRQWLASLGLYVQKTIGLAVAEDAKPSLMNRKGATLLRDIRSVTGVQSTSLLKDREFDVLVQSYTVRPTTMPRTSGLLILSFSADQFADDAVGEVWEGIEPASIGRHRERQLAAALIGKDFIAPFPDNLMPPPVVSALPKAPLPAYALFDNGKTVLSGRFDVTSTGPLSPLENPVGYLADLRDRAVAFIALSCPKAGPGRTTTCEQRLLGQDAIEWMVTWVADNDNNGQINAIELLHERRFSGMGSTVNVVFGK